MGVVLEDAPLAGEAVLGTLILLDLAVRTYLSVRLILKSFEQLQELFL